MIQSMTGYGKTVLQLPSKKVTVEIKSLNSKNLDLNARVPSAYREKELTIRNLLAKSLKRGKVDFSLYVEVTGEATNTQVNATIVKQYMEQLKHVVPAEDIDLLKMALRLPDTLKTEREEVNEDEFAQIINAVEQALKEINKYRSDEGAALEKDFKARITNIKSLLEEVIKIDPERIANVKERLQKAVAEIKEKVDENRFEQELMYYLEKYDITEEKVRLTNHLDYFLKALSSDDSNGKKLGFITQEIGREINTIGSKANYASMQQVVVQMKDELEKIKEQALNVL
ncbi:YicC/YloC family endoribonuclease [Patiriisocius hiemis]|uniref:YicC/YloC family endoribonuclease n=1 Tax=Patiriisocius hiemis TaxID=3075604 RepID=A0ABU2YE82_9FLAO|nr:YicC/YloC family endoribonuclease [Constantimarinum sp. W242]MDT0556504.1 YicC/YloC family endoribonuclease [Constantimarinum sp. W242]